jgi:hypothetical protein
MDLSIQAHMRLTCAKLTSRIRNGDFKLYNIQKALHRPQRSLLVRIGCGLGALAGLGVVGQDRVGRIGRKE